MNLNGTKQRRITNSLSVDWVYASYDNSLFLLSDRDTCHRCFQLYTMELSGKNLRMITNFILADSWMGSRKNGTEWIVKPAQDSMYQFYIIDLDGTILEKISVDLAYVSDPDFSPDGESIVFRGSETASPRIMGFTDALYTLDLTNKSLRKITFHSDEGQGKQWTGYLAGAPRWRKDGMISYASKRDGQYDIFLINADGGGERPLTSFAGNQVFHDWAPDGSLVYETSPNNQDGYDLYLRKLDGRIIRLTEDGVEQFAPVFARAKRK